ncbi:MAG: hypothetical protein E6R08_06340 [Nevskiaceae bacterium]|nr:MAG: hypothetical protein E6R08_06340 [Nevskiaceae bacterium]
MNERQINTIISTIGRVGREHANRRPGDQTGYSTRLRRAIEPLLEELNGGGTHRKIQMAWDVLRFHGHPQEGNEPLHTAIADLLDEKNEEIARLKSQIAGKSSLRELGRAWGGA